MTHVSPTTSGRVARRTVGRGVVSAVIGVLLALALAPSSAFAISPSPRVLAMMRQDPAFAKHITTHLQKAAEKGVDAPTYVTRGPLPKRVVSGSASSAAAAITVAAPISPLKSFAFPNGGAIKWLVLCVDFSDNQATTSAISYDSLVFGDVTGPTSARGYYREVSAGKVDLQPVTHDLPSNVGWLRMPQTYAYYVGADSTAKTGYGTDASYPHNAVKLFEDACAAANSAGVDFSQYDNNKDGYVDGVILIHAGPGGEFTGDYHDIWSHSWASDAGIKYDGVTIGEYTTEPEYWGLRSGRHYALTAGVFVHELGHNFGLPDLYDTTYATQGLGTWSLMAGGEWNGPNLLGGSPARFDAWSLTQLGLDTALDATGAIVPETIRSATSAAEGTILRIERGAGTTGMEYFLVENRQQTGTDSYLAGEGLLIYHVDETQTDNDHAPRYLVRLEEAHGGTQHLLSAWDKTTNPNDGDAGDPFPGTANRRLFSDQTDPAAMYYDGNPSNIRVDSISANSTVMTARVIPDVTYATTDLTPPVTTSNAVSYYASTATIRLTAHDETNGSGVKATHWVLDGLSGTGTTVTAGFGAHHLEFWSEDWAGHVETANSVDFSVGDEVAPVVSTNAAPSYSTAGPVTVTVTATDAPSGSGVASLSVQVDSQAIETTSAERTTVQIQFAGQHTLTVWARDVQGNESAHVARTIKLNNATMIKLTTGNVTIWSGVTFRVAGRIDPLASSADIVGKKLRLQKLSGASWVSAGVADTSLAPNYTFSFGPKPTRNTTYRVIAVTSSGLLPGTSPTSVRAYVKAVLGTPMVPSTITRYVSFTTKGATTPHDIGSVVVRWYKYSSSGSRYSYGTPKTVLVSSLGTWHLKKKLPKGKYAVRVTHSDATHVYSSSGYRIFSVK